VSEDISFGPDERNPDASTCRNCGGAIVWDEYSYVHVNGWADCHVDVVPTGRTLDDPDLDLGELGRVLDRAGYKEVDIVAHQTSDRPKVAEPIEWDTVPKVVT
jgi:hypothetical protein